MMRDPNEIELAILKKLLSRAFPGAEDLRAQLPGIQVETLDPGGSIKLVPPTGSQIAEDIEARVPVEGWYVDGVRDSNTKDISGDDALDVKVHLLLHVVEGRLHELEVYKDDGSAILIPPSPERISISPA
ncbi:MAG: hypothetical protein AB7W16_09320 [Candidatus Obscuribacterales bacterium]